MSSCCNLSRPQQKCANCLVLSTSSITTWGCWMMSERHFHMKCQKNRFFYISLKVSLLIHNNINLPPLQATEWLSKKKPEYFNTRHVTPMRHSMFSYILSKFGNNPYLPQTQDAKVLSSYFQCSSYYQFQLGSFMFALFIGCRLLLLASLTRIYLFSVVWPCGTNSNTLGSFGLLTFSRSPSQL